MAKPFLSGNQKEKGSWKNRLWKISPHCPFKGLPDPLAVGRLSQLPPILFLVVGPSVAPRPTPAQKKHKFAYQYQVVQNLIK